MGNFNLKTKLNDLIQALDLEKKAELDRYEVKAKELSIQEKIQAGICLYPLDFKTHQFTDSGQTILSFECQINISSTFKIGTPIKVFNVESNENSGLIRAVKSNEIQIVSNKDDVLEWVKKGKIGIQILADTKTIDLYRTGLSNQLEAPSQLLQSFYLPPPSDTLDLSEKLSFSTDLNPSQIKAVNHIIGQNPISIIHGPPGTGKTTCLVTALKHLHLKGNKIIVTAPTHTAVDHIAKQLIAQQIDFLRIGHDLKVDEAVEPFVLDAKIQSDPNYQLIKTLRQSEDNIRKKAFQYKRNFGTEAQETRKRLRQELKSIRKDIRRLRADLSNYYMSGANIVLGTFIGLKQIESEIGMIDYLCIDEAGQAIEPAIWLLSPIAKKLVIIGDHCQLPPVIFNQKAIDLGLNQSLLQIATERQFPKIMLDTQYRMPDVIMQFSNQYFYQNQLKTASSLPLQKSFGHHIEFIDTSGCGFEETKDESSGSISNAFERQIIKQVLTDIDVTDMQIGIISPYRSQIEFLKIDLPEQASHINTIDAFQGQERDLIIISLVRNNTIGEIGFLKDYRRMNVALTRAKAKLILVGDAATFGQDQFYSALVDYIETNGQYRSGWEFLTI